MRTVAADVGAGSQGAQTQAVGQDRVAESSGHNRRRAAAVADGPKTRVSATEREHAPSAARPLQRPVYDAFSPEDRDLFLSCK